VARNRTPLSTFFAPLANDLGILPCTLGRHFRLARCDRSGIHQIRSDAERERSRCQKLCRVRQADSSCRNHLDLGEWSFQRGEVFCSTYRGAKGTHLTVAGFTGTGINLNQLPDQYDSIGGSAALGTGLFRPVSNPLSGKIPTGGILGGSTILEGYLLKPFPQYTGFTQTVPRYGWSNYTALQATFQRHFSHNGLVQVAYTYSKLLSNTENTSFFEDGEGGLGMMQDQTNLPAAGSISMQDLTQNMVINYGVDLPFGHGQEFLSKGNGTACGAWRAREIRAAATTIRSAPRFTSNLSALDSSGMDRVLDKHGDKLQKHFEKTLRR
jgi:hypothetical protein